MPEFLKDLINLLSAPIPYTVLTTALLVAVLVWRKPLTNPLVFIGVLFYLMVLRPERQKQSTHKQMLTDLKKNDRVITAGGIKGIVANIQRDADEVTINVDESSGTKIRVTLASIARVVTADAKGDSKKT